MLLYLKPKDGRRQAPKKRDAAEESLTVERPSPAALHIFLISGLIFQS
jgi:hypothetical protein